MRYLNLFFLNVVATLILRHEDIFTLVLGETIDVIETIKTIDQVGESELKDSKNGVFDEENILSLVMDVSDLSDDELADVKERAEGHEYQAEVTRILDIIVNSLYSTKEIFLRELISNAADALEKYKITALQGGFEDFTSELSIKIRTVPNKRRLVVADNGIGMTKHELINNLGTIAKSGTANFIDAISKGEKDSNLIGQFGVGFYSVFLVADHVIVQTKHPSDKQYVWKSSADTKYELLEDPKGNTLGVHGTQITLILREDSVEFLKDSVLESLVKKYSQFVRSPIYLQKVDESKSGVKWVHINNVPPIWSRDKSEITQEEYDSFYQAISGQSEKPLAHIHFSAEGEIDFCALLFIPPRPPNVYFDHTQKSHNVSIYTRRVLVSDNLPDFLPRYLFSLYGVVDSDSFPLNVSREHLQQSKMIKVIGNKIVRSVLDKLHNLMGESIEKKNKLKSEIESETNDEKVKELKKQLREQTPFDKFYQAFRGSLKVACYDDISHRKKISKLLMFKTSKHEDFEITLDQYISEMQKDQKYIYYASGDSYRELHSSPHMQGFLKRGIDVVYLLDTMDESCITQLHEYGGKQFKSVQKGEVAFELTQEEQEEERYITKRYKPLIKALQSILPEIFDVKISRRLTNDPCTVVSSDWGMSAHMEKVVKSYVVHKRDEDDLEQFGGNFRSRILEINPHHPIIIELLRRSQTEADSSEFKKAVILLYDAAKLASGFTIQQPIELSHTAYNFLAKSLQVNDSITLEDIPLIQEPTFDDKFDDKFEDKFDDKFKDKFEDKFEDKFKDKFDDKFDDKFEDKFDDKFEDKFDDKFKDKFDDKFKDKFDDKFKDKDKEPTSDEL